MRYLAYAAVLIGLFLFAYLAYAGWAHLRWKSYVAEIEASGSSLILEELLPTDPATESFWDSDFSRRLREESEPPLSDPWEKLELAEPRIDHFAWRTNPELGVRSGSWISAHPRNLSGYFPEKSFSREEAATVLLQAMDVLEEDFAALADAVSRPLEPFPWESVTDFTGGVPNGAQHFNSASDVLALRGICHLEVGDSEAALADLITMLRMDRVLVHEGTLIDQMIAGAVRGRGFQIAWEGLEANPWTEEQLAQLDREIDLTLSAIPPLSRTLMIERAYAHETLEQNLRTFSRRWDFLEDYLITDMVLIVPPDWISDVSPLERALAKINQALFAAIPLDVYRLALRSRDRLHEKSLLDLSLPLPDRIEKESRLADAFQTEHGLRNPATVFNQMEFGTIFGRLEASRIQLESLRAAVAAERYRLAHEKVPDTWNDLVPQWLPAIPEDPWSGGGQVYLLDDQGRPIIYSVGQNLVDDHGRPHRSRDRGDLVWRYSLPSGTTLEEFYE